MGKTVTSKWENRKENGKIGSTVEKRNI